MNKDKLFSEFPFINEEGLILRKIGISDLDNLYEIYSNENLFKYRPGNSKKNIDTVKNMISHFERDFSKKKIIFLGICLEASKELVGVAEIFEFDEHVNSVSIGYTLNENYFGKGIAGKTVSILIDYLFNAIDVNRIQAEVMPINVKSQNVLKRNGFIKEGTIRQGKIWTGKGIVDLDIYSLLKSDIDC